MLLRPLAAAPLPGRGRLHLLLGALIIVDARGAGLRRRPVLWLLRLALDSPAPQFPTDRQEDVEEEIPLKTYPAPNLSKGVGQTVEIWLFYAS